MCSKGEKLPTGPRTLWLITEVGEEDVSDEIEVRATLCTSEAGDHVENKPDNLLLGKHTKIIRLSDESRKAGESSNECSTSPITYQNIKVSEWKARLLARSCEVISRQ